MFIDRRTLIQSSGFAAIAWALRACKVNVPHPVACGTFAWSVESIPPNPTFPSGHYPGPGRISLAFSFNPQLCSASPCTCRKIGFVQAFKYVIPPYTVVQPNQEQTDRMVQNPNNFYKGWAIDRGEGSIYPYYGMFNDGTFVDPAFPDPAPKCTPGSNTTPAVLRDSPYNKDHDSYTVMAISAPVCIDEQSLCNAKVLGYFSWSWSANRLTGDFTNYFHDEPGTDLYVQAFDMAVQEWNNHLGGTRQPLTLSKLP